MSGFRIRTDRHTNRQTLTLTHPHTHSPTHPHFHTHTKHTDTHTHTHTHTLRAHTHRSGRLKIGISPTGCSPRVNFENKTIEDL